MANQIRDTWWTSAMRLHTILSFGCLLVVTSSAVRTNFTKSRFSKIYKKIRFGSWQLRTSFAHCCDAYLMRCNIPILTLRNVTANFRRLPFLTTDNYYYYCHRRGRYLIIRTRSGLGNFPIHFQINKVLDTIIDFCNNKLAEHKQKATAINYYLNSSWTEKSSLFQFFFANHRR